MYIRKATLQDIENIATLEEATFSVPWSREAIEKDLSNPVATYFVAEENESIVGYVGVWCVLDEGQITNVAVHKNYRQQGIGRQLIQTLIAYAKEKALMMLLLEVRESNEAAKKLYQSCQFESIAKRKNYYTKPVEDACIMQLDL